MELKDVYELWDRFDSSKATLIELELKGDHLKLVSGMREDVSENYAKNTDTNVGANIGTNIATNVGASVGANIGSSVDAGADEKISEKTLGTSVKAPLVGTFYAAPSPDEEPFVTVGKTVKKGDVVGIIEAMKLMNEVVAPVDGKVTKIEAKDGCMVQYEQTILVIE